MSNAARAGDAAMKAAAARADRAGLAPGAAAFSTIRPNKKVSGRILFC